MQRTSADFTNTFRTLSISGSVPATVETMTTADPDFEAWQSRWQARRARQPNAHSEADDLMRRHNPAYIPRNHKVEEALEAATAANDFSVMERLLDVLRRPYDHSADLPEFSTPAIGGRRYLTFCGT